MGDNVYVPAWMYEGYTEEAVALAEEVTQQLNDLDDEEES